ncbi:alkylmercury lyase family protein [Kaarinaea lacus]
MDIKQAIERLNSQLPLQARQSQLAPELKATHQAILRSLVNKGQPPTPAELEKLLGENAVDDGLQRLAKDDLIVLDTVGKQVVGAYPVTIEKTPHRILVNGHNIFAMCALDAVSVAPMFDAHIEIASQCNITREPIAITMQGAEILTVQPSSEVRIGVRWQMPCGVAAHSMCLEMVFLLNEQVASEWQNDDVENKSLFDLPHAVEFGRQFFMPLLD